MQTSTHQGRRDFSVLNDNISQLEGRIATLKTENRNIKIENMDLLERNTEANLTISKLRSQVDILSQDVSRLKKSHLSKKLPDPKIYNGDKQTLRSWIICLRMKLAGNLDHYPTESNKIQYAVGRLGGNALDQVGPKLREDGTTDFATADDLIAYLEMAFGDPDEKDTAQRQLRELRQASRAFSDYLADFRRIVDLTGYNDEAKRAALLAGLSQDLQQVLVAVDHPDSLEETIAQIQKIDNRIQAFNSNRAFADSNHQILPLQQAKILAPQLGSQSKSVQSASSSSSPSPGRSVSSRPSSTPRAASRLETGVRGHRGRLTPMERQYRIDNNRCMYCGNANHLLENCPKEKRKDVLGGIAVRDSIGRSADPIPRSNPC